MTQHSSRLTIGWPAAVGIALFLLAAGAMGAYLTTRSDMPANVTPAIAASGGPAASVSTGATTPGRNEPLPDVTVALSADAVTRAGIVVSPAGARDGVDAIRVPATVEANAYRRVDVTPIAAGRVTRVAVALGEQVKQGQLLAQIFSPELADAQTQYVAERAALEAHEKEVGRTAKLADIGAASQQELERVRAEHTERSTRLQSIAARLALLGRPQAALASIDAHAAVDAVLSVPAPLAGLVLERNANVGQNVDTSTKLFTVVDLSTVWVVANVFEKDLARVRVGDEAVVTTAVYPAQSSRGRIAYIDPQVTPDTRTAGVRVELANANHDLRLGMLAEVQLSHSQQSKTATWIPTSAIQQRGAQAVVYVAAASGAGQFIERGVQIGGSDQGRTEVLTGVRPGDPVVTEGSFALRAEIDRQGLRPAAAPPIAMPMAATQSTDVQTAKIVVNEKGFEPAEVTLRANTPAKLTFVRVSENTCATELLIESLKIRRELPLNTPVEIGLTAAASGKIGFTCGMKMFRGTVLVR